MHFLKLVSLAKGSYTTIPSFHVLLFISNLKLHTCHKALLWHNRRYATLRKTYILIIIELSVEWISGDDSLQSNWTATVDDSILYLQTQLTQPEPYMEVNDRPLDGIAYNAILQVSFPSQYLYEVWLFAQRRGITWCIADSDSIREQFESGNILNNTVDPMFHPIGMSVVELLLSFITANLG